MTIIFNIDDFLFELFPVEKDNLEQLKDYLIRYYAVGANSGQTEPLIPVESEPLGLTIIR